MGGLRVRLVLAFAAVITIMLITAGASLLVLMRAVEDRLLEARLRDLSVPAVTRLAALTDQDRLLITSRQIAVALERQATDLNIHALIVDPSARVRWDTTPGQIFMGRQVHIPDLDTLQPLHGASTSGSLQASDGSLWVYVAYRVPLGDADFGRAAGLVLLVPGRDLATGLDVVWRVLLVAAVISLVVALVLAMLLARWLSRPLRRLERATDQVAAGNFDLELPSDGPNELRQLSNSFNRMAQQVRQAQRSQRDFLANASHELRTPLTSIQGFSQAMVEGAVTDKEGFRRAARVVMEAAQRLTRLVEEILDLSRLESGGVELLRQRLDLTRVVTRALEMFEQQGREQNIDIRTDLQATATVIGDADRLGQVLTNTLGNALRHTPDGGQIDVTLRAIGDHFAEVSVRDSGPGIPPGDMERIFERFQTGPDGSNAGLGLAIAREIARAHGGELTAANASGGGARLVLRLPLAPADG